MTIAADPAAPDSFTTEVRYTVARTGETVSHTGKALVYTGFQWRGRADDWREVMFVERNWKDMWGRWFTGAYDETGIDVKLTRLGGEPIVLADQNRARWDHLLIGRGLAALEVPGEEQQDVLHGPPAPEHGGGLAERRHHPVGAAQGGHAADLGRLLAFERGVRRQPALEL